MTSAHNKANMFWPVVLAALLACCAPHTEASRKMLLVRQLDVTTNALTNNALTNNALTNNALTNNALTNNALTNNALTNNALTNNALTNNALTNNALTNNALTANALTNNALTNNALTNNALTNNLLTANSLTSNSLTSNSLTANSLTANSLTNNALTANALTNNALTNNALTNNALTNNALTNNALTNNALQPNGLQLNAVQMNGLNTTSCNSTGLTFGEQLNLNTSAGDNARMLLKYMVECAFTPEQSFNLSGTLIPGSLGLAPEWHNGPLSINGQEWVSACLAARTNYYGVKVDISMRGTLAALKDSTTPAELKTFNRVEGAFWGNWFKGDGALYACHDNANIANSRAHKRDCAAGHRFADGSVVGCGVVTIVGSCKDVCRAMTTATYYDQCSARNVATRHVITIYLPKK